MYFRIEETVLGTAARRTRTGREARMNASSASAPRPARRRRVSSLDRAETKKRTRNERRNHTWETTGNLGSVQSEEGKTEDPQASPRPRAESAKTWEQVSEIMRNEGKKPEPVLQETTPVVTKREGQSQRGMEDNPPSSPTGINATVDDRCRSGVGPADTVKVATDTGLRRPQATPAEPGRAANRLLYRAPKAKSLKARAETAPQEPGIGCAMDVWHDKATGGESEVGRWDWYPDVDAYG
jgi:hypothetical protein